MITTRYKWGLDPKRKILFSRYGSILRDDLVWHFRGAYFNDMWTRLLTRNPMGASRSLQDEVRNVENGIAKYRKSARRVLLLRAIGLTAYTMILVAIPVAILFAWPKSSGY